MYCDFYGLKEMPFRITPNLDLFYAGCNRGGILDALLYAIASGEGIIKVVGEVGSGKTMLCRMVESRLPPNIESIYLNNPSLSKEEILYAIAGDLKIDLSGQRPTGLTRILQAHLIQKYAQGRQVVVFIDEAQAMPLETLEEIRLLTNLETGTHKLLQIVLFGQPELDEHLGLPQIRQLRERITHNFTLPPFSREDIRDYLMFRLRAVGYRGPDIFDPRAINLIARASKGLVRRVNILADKALLAAFAGNSYGVKVAHAQAAVRDSGFGPAPARPARWALPAAVLGASLAGAGAGWFASRLADGPPPQPAQPAAVAAPAARARPAPPPAEAAAQPPAASETPPPSLLQQRLAATRQWLRHENEGNYTIQIRLLPGEEPGAGREIGRLAGELGSPEQIFVFPTRVSGEKSVGITFGNFATEAAAKEALSHLPPPLRENQPWLRTIRSIRAELREKQIEIDG
jgi:type II secretory pathway predicted ATPase ExeA